MFSKKISLFVVPFLSIMMIANLFAIPVYGDDLGYSEDGVQVNDGQLIYLVAQANGIKFNGKSTDVFKYLNDSYKHYSKFVPSLVDSLVGFVSKGVNGLLSVSRDVYNSIVLFLRDYYYDFGYIDSNGFILTPLGSTRDYYFSVGGDYSPVGKLPNGKHLYIYNSGYPKNGSFDCRNGGCIWHTIGDIYTFKSRNGTFLVSTSINSTASVVMYDKSTGQHIEKSLGVSLSNKYSDYGITLYYTDLYGGSSLPLYYSGVYMSSPHLDISSICYLFSNKQYKPSINYVNDFNINNISSSSTNVTISNIYYNEITNNITINNNGVQEPIDDNVQGDVVAPTVPNIKPYDVVIDLNNIDTINNYHNDLDKNINDFLIQFNDNLNKIDTNCYSLTSCAINGLKSVANSVNDITGYNENGMNSDIVLLISLFLLLGILFTIL